MITLTKLVNDGKRILGEDPVFWCLNGLYHSFFEILERGDYSKEIELLEILEKWANNGPSCMINRGNVNVCASVFNTHQQYVRGSTKRREFGDVTFATIFSHHREKKVGFANTFQIKVDFFTINAYRNLFASSNRRQLDFYRTNLIEALDPMYDSLICDFLHYFLIGAASRDRHPIMEVPLSFTWLDDSSGAYWGILPSILDCRYISGRNTPTGLDTRIRKLLLTTGINIDRVLPLCTPKLRGTLEGILRSGVNESKKNAKTTSENDSNNKYPNKGNEEFVPPDFPLSSSIVVATEVSFLD